MVEKTGIGGRSPPSFDAVWERMSEDGKRKGVSEIGGDERRALNWFRRDGKKGRKRGMERKWL